MGTRFSVEMRSRCGGLWWIGLRRNGFFTGVTKHDLIGERKIAARVGLAAEWIETWPLTDLYTVHVNERLSQIGAGH